MIGRVQVLAIPACGETESSHDAGFAWLSGEVESLGVTSVKVVEASKCKLPVLFHLLLGSSIDVANVHTETLNHVSHSFQVFADNDTYWLEGSDL